MPPTSTHSLLVALLLLSSPLVGQELQKTPVQERAIQKVDQERLRQARPDLTATPGNRQNDAGEVSEDQEQLRRRTSNTTTQKVHLDHESTGSEVVAGRKEQVRLAAEELAPAPNTFEVVDLPSEKLMISDVKARLRTVQTQLPPDSFVVGRLPIGPRRFDDLEPTGPVSPEKLRKAVEEILRRQKPIPGGPGGPVEPDGVAEGEDQAGPPPAQDQSDMWTLPYQVLGKSRAGNSLNLQPIVVVDAGGLRPAAGGSFWGRIWTGVVDADRPNASHSLAQTITFLIAGDLDAVDPQKISFDRTNQLEPVNLTAGNPSDPVLLRVVPTFDPRGALDNPIQLAVLRGSLEVTVSPKRIQGLGLETARINVRAVGIPHPESLAVNLSSNRGSIDPSTLSLDSSGFASTELRSVTVGTATVNAASVTALAPGQDSVQFLFPWLFLGAALLGGATGGLISRARTERDDRRAFWLDLLVLGVLVGLVVACAYSVGINLLPVQPSTHAGEALVFVLAALGALFGLPTPATKPEEPGQEPPEADPTPRAVPASPGGPPGRTG